MRPGSTASGRRHGRQPAVSGSPLTACPAAARMPGTPHSGQAGTAVPMLDQGRYMRPNHGTWLPRIRIDVAMAGSWHRSAYGSWSVPSAWNMTVSVRDAESPHWQRGPVALADNAEDVAGIMESAFRGRKSVWVYCPSTIELAQGGRLAAILFARGWHLSHDGIAGRFPVLRWRRKNQRMTWTTPMSYFGYRDMDGMRTPSSPRPSEPGTAGSAGDLARLAASDRRIITAAMDALMAWWHIHDCGRWQPRGPGCASSLFRHKIPGKSVLADTGRGWTQFARKAAYGGARFTTVSGMLPPGRYLNLDARDYYGTIMEQFPLPVAPGEWFLSMAADDERIWSAGWSVIAEVTINGSDGRVPVRFGQHIVRPRGYVRTVMAGPMIAECVRRGLDVRIGAGRLMRLGDAWSAPAAWLLRRSRDHHGSGGQWGSRFAKAALRYEVGKTAQWGFRTGPEFPAAGTVLECTEMLNASTGQADYRVCINGTGRDITRTDVAGNTVMGVCAMVQSIGDVYLWRAVDAAPPGMVVAADTDGIEMASPRPEDIEAVQSATAPFTFRPKQWSDPYVMLGPQMFVGSTERKMAGIPAGAVHDGHGGYDGSSSPRLRPAPAGLPAGAVTRGEIHVSALTSSASGWVTVSGQVVQPATRRCTCMRPEIIAPDEPGGLPEGMEASPDQPAVMRAVLAESRRMHEHCRPWWGPDSPGEQATRALGARLRAREAAAAAARPARRGGGAGRQRSRGRRAAEAVTSVMRGVIRGAYCIAGMLRIL